MQWLQEQNRQSKEDSPFSGLEGGLRGKAIPKVMSIASTLLCLDSAAEAIDTENLKTKDEKEEIMKRTTVEIEHVKCAIALVEYSNDIHRLLDSFKSSEFLNSYILTSAYINCCFRSEVPKLQKTSSAGPVLGPSQHRCLYSQITSVLRKDCWHLHSRAET